MEQNDQTKLNRYISKMKLSGISLQIDTVRTYPVFKSVKFVGPEQSELFIDISQINNGKVIVEQEVIEALLDRNIVIDITKLELTYQPYNTLKGIIAYIQNYNTVDVSDSTLAKVEEAIRFKINSVITYETTISDFTRLLNVIYNYFECKIQLYLDKHPNPNFGFDYNYGDSYTNFELECHELKYTIDVAATRYKWKEKELLSDRFRSNQILLIKNSLHCLDKAIGNVNSIFRGYNVDHDKGTLSAVFNKTYLVNMKSAEKDLSTLRITIQS
jgi:hypothetical protein